MSKLLVDEISDADNTGPITVTDGAVVNRTGDGTIIDLQVGGTTVGSIRSRAGVVSTLILDPRTSVGTGVGITGSSQNAILPTDAGGNFEDAAIDFGDGSTRFKDLYLSGGVYLGGTGAANLLDDYEEGTFTATLTAATSAPTTAATTTAYYTKTGNVVNVFIRFSNKDTSGASGDMSITGLPFTSRGVAENQAAVPMMHKLTISDKYVSGYISGGTTSIGFINNVSNAVWSSTQINATTAVYLNMNMTYQVA